MGGCGAEVTTDIEIIFVVCLCVHIYQCWIMWTRRKLGRREGTALPVTGG